MASVEVVLVAIIVTVHLTTGTLLGPGLIHRPHISPPIHPLAVMGMPSQHVHLKPPLLLHKTMFNPVKKIFKPLIIKKVKYVQNKPMVIPSPQQALPVLNALPLPRSPSFPMQPIYLSPPPRRTNYRIQPRQRPTLPLPIFRGNGQAVIRQLSRMNSLPLPMRQVAQPTTLQTRLQTRIQPRINAFSPRPNPRWYDDDDDDDDDEEDNEDDNGYDDNYDDDDSYNNDDDIYDGYNDYWENGFDDSNNMEDRFDDSNNMEDIFDDSHDMEDIFDQRLARRNRNSYDNFVDRFDDDFVDDFEMSDNSNYWNRNREHQAVDTMTEGRMKLVGDDLIANTRNDESNSGLIENLSNNDQMTDTVQSERADGNSDVIDKGQIGIRRDTSNVSSPSMNQLADERTEHYDNLADRRGNNLDNLANQRSNLFDNLESRRSKSFDSLADRRSRNVDIVNDRRDNYLDTINSRRGDIFNNIDYRNDNNVNNIRAPRLRYSSSRFDVNKRNNRRGRRRQSNNIYSRRGNFSNDRGDTTDSSR